MNKETVHQHWRLLPSERVLWQGAPKQGVPRDRRYLFAPALLFAFAVVVLLFAGLVATSALPGARSMIFLACYLGVTGVGALLAPRYLLDPCHFMVTDRHVIWRRGARRRAMDRRAITYARIHWHRSVPGLGHLEVVRAVPFGPLSRRERLMLHDVEAPDRVLALIRDVEPARHSGYADVRLIDRLDPGERVLWGAGPSGWRLGRSELLTAFVGLTVSFAALAYCYRTGSVLVELERVGLPVQSWTWVMLFLAMVISGSIMVTVGVGLVYHGLWRARADGSATEYILTNTRILIRRGLTELSLDRRRVVDVAVHRAGAGSQNLFLILDGPNARALDDNGALSMFAPPRATVPPVLYEVDEEEHVRELILDRHAA